MNFDRVMQLIGRWGGTLKFFPSDPEARIGIAEEIASMATDEAQVQWLVSYAPKLYQEWPGVLELRAVFCTKFKPADGIEAALGTKSPAFGAVYPDLDNRVPSLSAATPLQIESGASSAAPSLAAAILDLARAKDMNRIAGKPVVREIPVVRLTEANRITPEQIAAAVHELRDKKAREVAGLEAEEASA